MRQEHCMRISHVVGLDYSDQPVHLQGLARDFAAHIHKVWM